MPGDAIGENMGKLWYVAKSNYTIMIANRQLMGEDGETYLANGEEGTGLTTYFTDQVGRTLYAFASDKNNKNNYTKEDFSNDATWPIFSSSLTELPSTMDKSLFGEIDFYGKKQVTYKGWPLYYFGSDNKVRGSTRGVSVPRPAVWQIVNFDKTVAPQ